MAHLEDVLVEGQVVRVEKLDHSAQQVDDATGRALPGGEIDAAMFNKANGGVWTLYATVNEILPSATEAVTMSEIAAAMKDFSIVVFDSYYYPATRPFGALATIIITRHTAGRTGATATDQIGAGRWYGAYNERGGGWSGWTPIATATPPQEYALPLAAGVTRARKSYYIKKQNGRVQVHFCVSYQPAGGRTVVLGILPAGYRPADTETDTCVATEATGDVMGPATVEVLYDGTVRVYANVTGAIGAVGSIEFTATH